MSIILSVHSTKAFREFLLLAINNSEDSIILDKDTFALDRDIELQMEVIENCWYFLPSRNYRIEDTVSHQDYAGTKLKDGALLTILLPGQENISIMADETTSSFKVFEKYDIRHFKEIAIGKDASNDIVYDTRNLVSREHAVIRRISGQCVIEDRSVNGIFVNSKRVVGSRQLEFGDCINIFGLSLVYLEHILAVNSQNNRFQVNRSKLKEYCGEEAEGTAEAPMSGGNKKILFHRSPRQIYKIDDGTVEIEAPPQPKTLNKKSIGMLIGPSMTMALPMLLGCGLAIYSTRASGSTGSAFMYPPHRTGYGGYL